MPLSWVGCLRSADEHITRKTFFLPNETAPQTCLGYGGFALGNVTGEDARRAYQRLLDLKIAMSVQNQRSRTQRAFYRACFRESPCFITQPRKRTWSDARTDAALLIGSISIEQPVCDREPKPYYCGMVEEGTPLVEAVHRHRKATQGKNHAVPSPRRSRNVHVTLSAPGRLVSHVSGSSHARSSVPRPTAGCGSSTARDLFRTSRRRRA